MRCSCWFCIPFTSYSHFYLASQVMPVTAGRVLDEVVSDIHPMRTASCNFLLLAAKHTRWFHVSLAFAGAARHSLICAAPAGFTPFVCR
jgi:hypothetical protein